MEAKHIGGKISTEVADAFTAQVEERGHKKKRALEGAIKVWLNLPVNLQAEVMKHTQEVAGADVWGHFLDAFLDFYERVGFQPKIKKKPLKK